MRGDRPPGILECLGLIKRHRPKQRCNKGSHRPIGRRDRRGDRPWVDLVDESNKVIAVHRPPNGEPSKFEICWSKTTGGHWELPQGLTFPTQYEIDESTSEFRIRGARELANGIRIDHRLARGIHVADPPNRIRPRKPSLDGGIAGSLCLVTPVEVNADRGRRFTGGNLDGSLRAAARERPSIRGQPTEDPPTINPATPLEDRFKRGGHRSAHPGIDHGDPAVVFRNRKILPGPRGGDPQPHQGVSIENNSET